MKEAKVATVPRKQWLSEQIWELAGKDAFGNLSGNEKILLDSYKQEYQQILDKEAQEKAEKTKEISDRVKKSRARGKKEEYTCAKMTHGVVVGRSKAVQVNGRWYNTDCQKPPDVIAPPYSLEVKNRPIPKSIEKAMNQAVANAPENLMPLVWWRDKQTGDRYIIQLVRDFLADHIS